jgi:indole-3-glycerol phosphate synthase
MLSKTPTILDNIVKHKKLEVRKSKGEVRLSTLGGLIQDGPPARPFAAALKRNEVAVIAEVKKASPSAGLLRPDFDPVAIARIYQESGAAAISVLTDEKYFQGNRNYLMKIRQVVELPLLRKDFIIDPYQVIEARAYGADAVLLILSLLSPTLCLELMHAARECAIEILLEVHSREELERALAAKFKLIGINNRDLRTFEVDIRTSETLLSGIPNSITAISESGIKRRENIERLGKFGVDGVLVGEALMREADVGAALSEFVGVRKWSR